MAKRKPPLDKVQGPGVMVVGITEEWSHVILEFRDPDWWVHMTPDEARGLAELLVKKADDIDQSRRDAGNN